MRKLDLTGTRFGRLLVQGPAPTELGPPPRLRPRSAWRCLCDCGVSLAVVTDVLRDGRTRSCGCLRTDELRARSVTHGASKGFKRTPEYRAWLHAKGRCFTPTDHKFAEYGGRGITMCPEWRDNFPAFLAHVGPRPSAKHSLDRIEVNGDYEPGNVRWATAKVQSNNKRFNVYVQDQGERLSLKAFAERHGVNYKWLHNEVRMRDVDPHVAVRRALGK